MTRIAILGGGSWGTALSIVLSRSHKPHELSLWMRDPALAYAVSKSRVNELYLPACAIPAAVAITSDLAHALATADIIVGAMPSAYARIVYSRALPFVEKTARVFVSATKGLEPSTHLRITEVLSQAAGRQVFAGPAGIAVLSGPSFALEAARGDPTAVVVASQSQQPVENIALCERVADYIQAEFAGPSFRLYTQRRRSRRRVGRRNEKCNGHRRWRLPRIGPGYQCDRGVDHPWPRGNGAPGHWLSVRARKPSAGSQGWAIWC